MSSFVTYAGVADCHGIESFDLKDNMTSFERSCRIMRSAANGQRHAIYYEASMDAAAAELIMEYLKQGDCDDALRCLKRVAIEFSTLPEQEDLVATIPNPDLDPYT